MKTPHLKKSINRSPLRLGLLLIPLVLACFAILPSVRATPDPGAVGGGNSNAADGFGALNATVTGINNSGFGANALHNLTIGNNNAAQGNSALVSLIDGNNNTALGVLALRFNTTGDDNTAVGKQALTNNITGSFNTAIGHQAGNATLLNWNIDIGKDVFGAADDAFVTRIGISDDTNTLKQKKCFIGGIFGVTAPGTLYNVTINSFGQLSTAPGLSSSRRFKKEIKPMDKSSEVIFALKPVTFHYKSDAKDIPQFGLIAEEVAEVNPDLIVRDDKGEIYSVRYEQVNAMLLNEFLKEHQTVKALKSTVAKQDATVAQLKSGMEALAATVKEQASQIQKVSAQLEASKPAPQVVNNP
jgi:hypothetical protein